MKKTNKIFEIHQGEWAYLTEGNCYEAIATSNVAQCTVFYGGTQKGFAFMFHHDLPIRPRIKTENAFIDALELNVSLDEKVFCFLSGGWKYCWSAKVRSQYHGLVEKIKVRGYKIELEEDCFTTQKESFFNNCWVKGVGFNIKKLEPESFSKKCITKRSRPIKAWLPFCSLKMACP